MRQLTLDLAQHDEPSGTAFSQGVHEHGAGTAPTAHRLTFSHDRKAAAPRVLDGCVLAVLVYALARVDQVMVKGPVSIGRYEH